MVVGASSSALAGFIGMYAATKSNTRTAADLETTSATDTNTLY